MDTEKTEKILDIVMAFNTEDSQDDLLDTILTQMMEFTNSEAGTLYILEKNALHFRIFHNKTMKNGQINNINLPPVGLSRSNIQNISAYCALNNVIVAIENVYANTEFDFEGPRKYDELTGYKTVSMLTIPLTTFWKEPEVIGIIQLINSKNEEGEIIPYEGNYDFDLLSAITKVAANTLTNLIYRDDITKLFHSFAEVMTQAIDERSSYNNIHTKNVTEYSVNFAKYLSEKFPPGHMYHFDKKRLEQLYIAALLHDIGKIITPLEVMDKSDKLGQRLEPLRHRFEVKQLQLENKFLKGKINRNEFRGAKKYLFDLLDIIEEVNVSGRISSENKARVEEGRKITYINSKGKIEPIIQEGDVECLNIEAGTLTREERMIMQQHVCITERLLNKIDSWKYYENVPIWATTHHEFLDGSGYPKGLKGDEITFESRLLTIVDIFEALTAKDRPYKKTIDVFTSLNILNIMVKEGKLSKELVDLFAESKVWEYKESL